MKKKKRSKEITLVGYVRSTDQDLNDAASEISIEADGEEYVVEDEGLVEELLDFLDEEIEVTGIVTEDGDGIKYIKITDYELLEYDEDYGENSDFDLEEDDEDDDFREAQGN